MAKLIYRLSMEYIELLMASKSEYIIHKSNTFISIKEKKRKEKSIYSFLLIQANTKLLVLTLYYLFILF